MSIECGATVDDLFDRIAVDFPMLASMKSCLKFAVNQEFVDVDRTLSHGDEVAVIPAGQRWLRSSGSSKVQLTLTKPWRPFAARVTVGWRRFTAVLATTPTARAVQRLFYEAYEPMARRKNGRDRRGNR